MDAVRKAPSAVAAKQAEALGDLGPVSLVWGDGDAKSPAVDVWLDGRPWWLASTGRQIVGDVWLRAPWCPIFVDNRGCVGGQEIPDVGGPVVLLRTTDDADLGVDAGE